MKDLIKFEPSELNPIHFINAIFISIVLYLHHGYYANYYFYFLGNIKFNYFLQKFAVGGFFFFSGLKLTSSNLNVSIPIFFKKRFIRIYILYFLSILVASVTTYPFLYKGINPSVKNILFHIFCFQTVLPDLFGNNFHTLWFVSILFMCYLQFLYLRKYIFNTKKFLVKQLLIFSAISLCYLLFYSKGVKVFSKDFSIYLLFFSFGMIFSQISLSKFNFNKWFFLIFGFIGNLFLLIVYKKMNLNIWYVYIIYAFLVIFSNLSLFYFLIISIKNVGYPKSLKNIIIKYSYASFCIFLFHRSIWAIMSMIYPKGTFTQWLYMIFFGVPIIILFSYFIQYSFNFVLNNFSTITSSKK